MNIDLDQFKKKFIDEANTLLVKLDNVLIELEHNPENKQLTDEAFRVMHTIKGASGMFGFEKIMEITHEIETLYDLVRTNQMPLSNTLLELTFVAADHIRSLLTDELFLNEENINRHKIINESIAAIKGQPRTTKNNENTDELNPVKDITIPSTWNILFYPSDDLTKRCINLMYTFHDLFILGEYKIHTQPFASENNQYWSIFLITTEPYEEIENALLFVMDYCKITKIADFDIFNPTEFEKRKAYEDSLSQAVKPQPVVEITPTRSDSEVLSQIKSIKEPLSVNTPQNTTTHINVDASKLDTLMYLVSELVTTKSELLIALHTQNEIKALDAGEKIEKLSKLFSDNALNIRLVSLNEMLSKFKRLIRDLAKQLEKNIEFVTQGENTELDKNIIDAISEPIMHLIRNCIDHGIESPKIRTEKGKPAIGTIRFEAMKAGNFVYITISDDGAGINHEYVYNKAVEKNLVTPGTKLSEKEIYDLLFLPGFSTAQSLSNVSGRGVGMDIVLRKIQEIRGEISITSSPNIGTTFTIKLQQTISIIDTLLISSDKIIFAIPVEDIESCLLEAHENVTDRQSNLIIYDNTLIPYINLRDKFSTTKADIATETDKLIIINKQNKRFAVIADTIIGEFQAVIKPLGEAFSQVKFLSGASLLGDGTIALLLDVDKLGNEISNN